MRRIEAVTGRGVDELVLRYEGLVESLSKQLETPVQDLEVRVGSLQEEIAQLRRRLQVSERRSLRSEAAELLEHVTDVNSVKVVVGVFSASSVEGLRDTGDWLKEKLGSGVVGLGAVLEERPVLVVMITSDLVKRGLHAGRIAGDAARAMGGGGGGHPEMAQAGGKDKEKLDHALKLVPELVRKALS
jgi:alanyl-tRNA synthetase